MLKPPIRPAVNPALDEMKELHIARQALIKDRVAAQNRAHTRRSALLKRQAADRLRQIERQIAAIDAALRAHLKSDPALKARFDILLSIPGGGAMFRPSPVPPAAAPRFVCANASKIPRAPPAMPMPVSVTSKISRSSPLRAIAGAPRPAR